MPIDNSGCALVERDAFGRVFDCGSRGNGHLAIASVSFLQAAECYRKLATMIQASTFWLKMWLAERRSPRYLPQ